MTLTDLQTFTLAFLAIGFGLAAYLVRLHLLARRLERQARDLTGKKP